MQPQLRCPFWKKKRWWAALLLWLLILYPLSSGPLTYAAARGLLPGSIVRAAVLPLHLACRLSPAVNDLFGLYTPWWYELGKRHAASH